MEGLRQRKVKCANCELTQWWRERCRRCRRELAAPAADYVEGERVTMTAPNGRMRHGVVFATAKSAHFVNVLFDQFSVVHTVSKSFVTMEIVQ